MSPSAPGLVLSASPLDAESREALHERYGPELGFADLAALRREGLSRIVSRLRSAQAAVVIVAGPVSEIRLFGDYLVALAFLQPRARRELLLPGGEATALGVGRLMRSLVRIGSRLVLDLGTLGCAWGRVALLRRSKKRPRLAAGLRRCLYLKPAPFFGVSVGGSVGHVAGVANAMARSGTAVRLLAPQRQALVGPRVEQTTVEADFPVSPAYELNQQRYQARFVRAAEAAARDFAPDFLYQRYGLNDLSGVLLRRRFRRPLVLEFNGSEVWAQGNWGVRLWFRNLADAIERLNLVQADLVVVVSEALVAQAISLGADPSRVFFYPNCVDPEAFDPGRFGSEERRRCREELGVPADAVVLTFVGTFGRWHGTEILAEAIRRLMADDAAWLRQRRAHFLFVGDGAVMPRVRAILGRDLGAPFVTLAGMQPQARTPAILAASDVLLSPHVPNPDGTPFFGSPTKLFEYMAMAKPIVASDLDQIGWVLRGWRPGMPPPTKGSATAAQAALLVEPGSLDSLIAGLHHVLQLSDGQRQALGACARRLVLESFTWEKNVEAMMSRVHELTRVTSG